MYYTVSSYYFGRNDAKVETPVLWPPHAKSWLIGKDSDAGRDWGQEEKGATEDEMAGWHHWLDGRESEWTLGVGDGDREAWRAAIHGVTKSRTWLSDWSDLIWSDFIDCSVYLLISISLFILLSLSFFWWHLQFWVVTFLNSHLSDRFLMIRLWLWRRKWQPTPVFLPGESQDGGAWWAAVYGVAQSWTHLKWRSSSSMGF